MNGHSGIDINWIQKEFPDYANFVALNPGGQKEVFSAQHSVDGPVVLKIIHPRQDIETTKREILAASQFNGKRVPSILDAGVVTTPLGSCIWFRERRIEGENLRTLVSRGPFDQRAVLRLGLQTLETLVFAENLRIVHRDVKPENLIRDGKGDYWLLDFGLARHLNLSSLTATAATFGKFTVGYAPPEQFQNKKQDIDARADLFGLGVTLFECATGCNPFLNGARDALEVFRRVQSAPLPRLKMSITTSDSFADLVSAMTQPRRDHRPATAKEAHDWMLTICKTEGI